MKCEKCTRRAGWHFLAHFWNATKSRDWEVAQYSCTAHRERVREELEEQAGFVSIIVAGCVSKIQKINTKNGQPMLFATIEDFSPQPLEVVVFNSVLAKTLPVWEVNSVVLVEGRMSSRNDEVKMICDRAQKIG